VAHIGLICPEVPGHLNPSTTLARTLISRGHRVTLFARPDGKAKALAAGLAFESVGERTFPLGTIPERMAMLGRLSGFRALAFTLDSFRQATAAFLEDGPGRLRAAAPDLLLIDEVCQAAEAVAEVLRVPFITLCNALSLGPDPAHPPPVFSWGFSAGRAARLRNRALWWGLDRVSQSFASELRRYRVAHGLPASPLHAARRATIAQQPAFFDFPRAEQPANFHHTGPFHDASSGDAVHFPFERLDGRPLVYASMGTLQNRQGHVFRAIAEACVGLDVQLVLTLGRKGAVLPESFAGDPLVVPYAPQGELLQRAAALITHAGLNSALEGLVYGVPMVALPITNDQPGVAGRLAHLGVARLVRPSRLTPSRLRRCLLDVLGDPAFREAARAAQARLAELRGLERAADLVESFLA
jgi:MGT family glycosyltransferase